MSRRALERRLAGMQVRIPVGCPACRTPPPIVILHNDEPAPPEACPECGRVYPFLRVIRLVRVERGPQ
jgi:hypothetical protein